MQVSVTQVFDRLLPTAPDYVSLFGFEGTSVTTNYPKPSPPARKKLSARSHNTDLPREAIKTRPNCPYAAATFLCLPADDPNK